MIKLRENFWIWGHPTNTFLVPIDLPCDRKHESELAKDVANVGWSINYAWEHPEHVTEICELSKTYKNICRGIFDDFFSPSNPTNYYTNYAHELIAKYREEPYEAVEAGVAWMKGHGDEIVG